MGHLSGGNEGFLPRDKTWEWHENAGWCQWPSRLVGLPRYVCVCVSCGMEFSSSGGFFNRIIQERLERSSCDL